MAGGHVGVMSDEGLQHLRAADPVLGAIIDRYGPDGLSERREGGQQEHYGALVRAIVGQQLSTKAAAAIYRRLTERFGGRAPTPRRCWPTIPRSCAPPPASPTPR